MKVVILCGGRGSRMESNTDLRPKPMLEVGGKPIIWHIMQTYAKAGFTDFVLCLGYQGEVIKRYFLNYKALNNDFTIHLSDTDNILIHDGNMNQDWSVTLADTGPTAMTGARVKRIERYITDKEFLLTYGDGLTDLDIGKLISFHKSHGKIGTVTGTRPPARFGELLVEGTRVRQFREKAQTDVGLINAGFFHLSSRFFEYLDDNDACTLEHEPLEKLAQDGELMVFHHTGFWHPVDTPRDLDTMNMLWNKGEAPW